jgi:hypothetical protein
MDKCGYCFRECASFEEGEKKWCRGCVKGVHYIRYPAAKDLRSDGTVWREKPECIPSSPPWTTWSGLIQAKRDSEIGIKLAKMDCNATDGLVNKIKDSSLILGMWTAEV